MSQQATGYIDGCFLDRGNTNATTGAGGSHNWNLTDAKKAAWDAGHAELLMKVGLVLDKGLRRTVRGLSEAAGLVLGRVTTEDY